MKLKVLVIEDNEQNLYLTTFILEKHGYEVVQAPLPCLITVVKDINKPRIPSLKGKMNAKKAQITRWSAADLGAEESRLGLAGSPTEVWKISTPSPRAKGQIFEGDAQEAVNKLVEALKDYLI